MTDMPSHDPSRFKILPPGDYIVQITDEPEINRYGKAIGVIIKFRIISPETMGGDNASTLLWPWEESYGKLKELLGQQKEDWKGGMFSTKIINEPHPTRAGQMKHTLTEIQSTEEKERQRGIEKLAGPDDEARDDKAYEENKEKKEREPGDDEEEDDVPF